MRWPFQSSGNDPVQVVGPDGAAPAAVTLGTASAGRQGVGPLHRTDVSSATT